MIIPRTKIDDKKPPGFLRKLFNQIRQLNSRLKLRILSLAAEEAVVAHIGNDLWVMNRLDREVYVLAHEYDRKKFWAHGVSFCNLAYIALHSKSEELRKKAKENFYFQTTWFLSKEAGPNEKPKP